MDVGAVAAALVAGGVVDVSMDDLAKALQSLVNMLGVKYSVAIALVDRETNEVAYATSNDITPEIASTLFQMQGEVSQRVVYRQN